MFGEMGTWVTIRVYDDFHDHVVDGAHLRSEGVAFRLNHEIWGRRRGIFLLQVPKARVAQACQVLSIPEPEPYSYTPLSGLGHWLHAIALRLGLSSHEPLLVRTKRMKWAAVVLIAITITIIFLL